MRKKVLVTGGAGYLGAKLVRRLLRSGAHDVVVADVREPAAPPDGSALVHCVADVRTAALPAVVELHRPDVVVHLAAIVDPPKGADRAFLRSVDVEGARNVLDACLRFGVRRLVVASSGAAYGYHADNPEWIDEEAPLRGNAEFAYAAHKREVEEMLARARETHPNLEQVVFRIGTILGEGVRNQITRLFDAPRLLGVRGGDDRFVFVWDEDVAAAFERAIDSAATGVFNVAGDGALPMAELARRMGKPYVRLPAGLVRTALAIARPLGLTPYGPEQVDFLRYRPVLDNARLKREFGYTPEKTSSETFDFFLASRREGDRSGDVR